jgi:hypothetical protein
MSWQQKVLLAVGWIGIGLGRAPAGGGVRLARLAGTRLEVLVEPGVFTGGTEQTYQGTLLSR